MLEYKTVESSAFSEYEIQKSRFLTYIKHVESEQEAQEFIQSVKKKHFDARHNCYAYIIGERSELQKSSDDGEPSGTAGVPILEVLKKNELSDVAAVVTRYFGGIKLGAGGLIRAYGKSASLGVEASAVVKKSIFSCLSLTIDYDLLGSLENYLRRSEIRIKDAKYEDKVTLAVLIPQALSGDAEKEIVNICAARCRIEKLEPVYLNVPVD